MIASEITKIPSAIFDNGSGLCKVGISGEQNPRFIQATVLGYPQSINSMANTWQKAYYVGQEAQDNRSILTLNHPMQHGVVTSWDDMEKIWEHLYKDGLRETPKQRPVLLTEAPLNPPENRAKMVEIFFETFQVPALYVALQGLMALYATGKSTGVVLECGDGVTAVIPIYQGRCLFQSISRSDFAGGDVTNYLAGLFLEKGISLMNTGSKDIITDIKERLCYIIPDPHERMKEENLDCSIYNYILPDGQTMQIGDELFQVPECLFQPSKAGSSAPGIHTLVTESVLKSSHHFQKDLLNNLILSGGSTLCPGMKRRLWREIQSLMKGSLKVNIMAPSDRLLSVWIGASVITSLSTFQQMWMSSSDYNELGPSAKQNCFW
ncbi:actin, clone 302 isoform X1 [Monodelphis domestica]|uniref:Actin, clone 302-like n=1 Tax=Monodelphis domestica TaxID=13616 RepID=K7E6E7_MONDO|nr:actin, clone 302 isoform X1 [Monodelphis domestica]XP_056651952.1 actin, clone 302 isoform X1 [Monodelphis domestica]